MGRDLSSTGPGLFLLRNNVSRRKRWVPGPGPRPHAGSFFSFCFWDDSLPAGLLFALSGGGGALGALEDRRRQVRPGSTINKPWNDRGALRNVRHSPLGAMHLGKPSITRVARERPLPLLRRPPGPAQRPLSRLPPFLSPPSRHNATQTAQAQAQARVPGIIMYTTVIRHSSSPKPNNIRAPNKQCMYVRRQPFPPSPQSRFIPSIRPPGSGLWALQWHSCRA